MKARDRQELEQLLEDQAEQYDAINLRIVGAIRAGDGDALARAQEERRRILDMAP